MNAYASVEEGGGGVLYTRPSNQAKIKKGTAMTPRHFTAASIALVASMTSSFAPGALTPTIKTLGQIEARIIVNSSNTPGDATSSFKITNPGSYYLTANITGVSNQHGVLIAAPNLTLDLNGFSLIGVPGSRAGPDRLGPCPSRGG